jgi:hypothetical protein
MFEPYEIQIRAWREVEPAIPAATVLQRPMGADPSHFTTKSLYIMQRVVKPWRADRPMVLDGPMIGAVFRAYGEHVLIPELSPCDVVVLDKALAQTTDGGCDRPWQGSPNIFTTLRTR